MKSVSSEKGRRYPDRVVVLRTVREQLDDYMPTAMSLTRGPLDVSSGVRSFR